MKPIFAVYGGPGADRVFIEPAMQKEAELMDADYMPVFPADILGGILDNPRIVHFSLPGAVSSQLFQDALGKPGKWAIGRAVRNGMALDGTCAGGYLLGTEIDYCKEVPGHERQPDTAMGFFNATVRGELPLLRPHNGTLNEGWHRAAIARVSYGTKETSALYWGGGMLMPRGKQPDILVLSRYNTLSQRPIAMAAQQVGRGMVIFNGIHPEVSGQALLETKGIEKHDPNDGGQWRRALADELIKNEEGRQALWDRKMTMGFAAARPQKFNLQSRSRKRPQAPHA